jgi:hypothetical protein
MRLLERLNVPRRVIHGCEDKSPYLTRWFLYRSRWGCLYLHHIHRSDEGRDLHDHPWHFTSLILRGGYWEEMPSGRYWRGPGSLLFRRAEDAHRVEMDRPTVSLVWVSRRVRDWGFYAPTGWVQWRKYLNAIGCGED